MAKVNKPILKQWADGEVMHGPDYNRERDLLVDAYNDSQDQIDALKSTTVPAVSTAMIQNGAVTEPKIATGAVTNSKIGPDAVSGSQIAPDAISSRHIAAKSLNGTDIADKSITGLNIADSTITGGNIVNGEIATAKIAESAVTAAKIANNAIQSIHLSEQAVQSLHIAINAIYGYHIQQLAIEPGHLAEGAVTPTKITKESVTQFTYDKQTVDQRIADALTAGIPQEVIDEIKSQVYVDMEIIKGRVNTLETEVADLKQAVPPSATDTVAGITRLSSAVNSNVTDRAATPAAVKSAYDLAAGRETPAGAQAKANTAETNAKNASLPRAGGTLTGRTTIEIQAPSGKGWEDSLLEIRTSNSSPTSSLPRIAFHSSGAGVAKQLAGDHVRGGISVLNEDGNILERFNCGDLRFMVDGTLRSGAELFTSVANGKNDIAAAIRDKGGSAQGSDAFSTLATAIRNVNTSNRSYLNAALTPQGLTLNRYTHFNLANIGTVKNGFTLVSDTAGNSPTTHAIMQIGANVQSGGNTDSINAGFSLRDTNTGNEIASFGFASSYSGSSAYVNSYLLSVSYDRVASKLFYAYHILGGSDSGKIYTGVLDVSISESTPISLAIMANYYTQVNGSARAGGSIKGYLSKW